MENIKKNTEKKMNDCLNNFKRIISKLRTGRASPAILDGIVVDYYGVKTSITKLSSITVENSNTLKVNVFELNMRKPIEKAILNSSLGLNPSGSHGNSIRVPIPNLTEERRKELVKILRRDAEKSRICIRNLRRFSKEQIKKALNKKIITQDKEYDLQNRIQDITNIYIKNIDSISILKEKNIMEF